MDLTLEQRGVLSTISYEWNYSKENLDILNWLVINRLVEGRLGFGKEGNLYRRYTLRYSEDVGC